MNADNVTAALPVIMGVWLLLSVLVFVFADAILSWAAGPKGAVKRSGRIAMRVIAALNGIGALDFLIEHFLGYR